MKKILFLNMSERLHYFAFKSLEKEYNVNIEFDNFSSVIIYEEEVLLGERNILEYDYVLLGILGKNLELALYIEDYLKKKDIPFFKYGQTRDKDNKLNEYRLLLENNISAIPTIIAKLGTKRLLYSIQKKYSFPIIVKPIDGSQGRGIFKVDNVKDLINIIKQSSTDKDKLYLLQPFIPNSGDYRVFVLKDRILGIMNRSSQNEDEFRSNISLGGTGKVADLPENIKELALRAVKVFGLDIAGVDIIQNSQTGEYVVMEVNAAPQFEGLKKYLQVDVERNILEELLRSI
jgi:ribosomal protein S6--L-glutamate ligase